MAQTVFCLVWVTIGSERILVLRLKIWIVLLSLVPGFLSKSKRDKKNKEKKKKKKEKEKENE